MFTYKTEEQKEDLYIANKASAVALHFIISL